MGMKILVLALVWIAIGAVACIAWGIKLAFRAWKLDRENFESLVDEALENACYGIFRFKGESQASVREQMEKASGKPYVLLVLCNLATWPSALAIATRRINEAMNTIESEYASGIRTRKEKEAS